MPLSLYVVIACRYQHQNIIATFWSADEAKSHARTLEENTGYDHGLPTDKTMKYKYELPKYRVFEIPCGALDLNIEFQKNWDQLCAHGPAVHLAGGILCAGEHSIHAVSPQQNRTAQLRLCILRFLIWLCA
jgi:hypothetical protein